VNNGGEDDVGSVAFLALKMAAAEVSVALYAFNHCLDGRAAAQLAFDYADDAALLARDEDEVRIGGVVAAAALVDIGTLDLAAGERWVASMIPSSVWPSLRSRRRRDLLRVEARDIDRRSVARLAP
jgi:hypothetical protein